MAATLQGLYYPFGIVQGETFEFSFEFSIDGVEQYFDEYTFVGQVKSSDNELVTVADFSFSENEESADVIDVEIPASETEKIQTSSHIYEIKCTHTDTGKVTTLFYGTMEVKRTQITVGNPSSFTPPPIPSMM